MTIRFFLDNPGRETSPISVVVSFSGKQYKKGIATTVETKFWDQERQLSSVNQRHRNGIAVNSSIKKWENAIDAAFQNIQTDNIEIRDRAHFWGLVQCEMDGTPYDQLNRNYTYFSDYFENGFIKKHFTKKAHSRIVRFNVILQKVKDFEGHAGRHYTFEEIGLKFYQQFQDYMRSLKHSDNYFGSVVSVIKQVMREAKDIDKLHSSTEFLSSQFKAVSHEVDAVYLTTDELNKIHQAEIGDAFVNQFYPRAEGATRASVIRSYNIVKNRFLIGAFTGLRMSDFNRIDADNIKDGRITAITKKTTQKVIIPIHPVVRQILDNGFDLNESLSEQKTRLYIKDICKFVGITEDVPIRENEGGKMVSVLSISRPKVDLHHKHERFARSPLCRLQLWSCFFRLDGYTIHTDSLCQARLSVLFEEVGFYRDLPHATPC